MGQTGFVKARIKAGKIRQDKARAGQGRRLCAGHSLAAVALLSRLSELSELALLPAPPRAAAPPAGAIGGVIRTAAPSPCPPSDQATPPGSAPATPTPYPSPSSRPLPLLSPPPPRRTQYLYQQIPAQQRQRVAGREPRPPGPPTGRSAATPRSLTFTAAAWLLLPWPRGRCLSAGSASSRFVRASRASVPAAALRRLGRLLFLLRQSA